MSAKTIGSLGVVVMLAISIMFAVFAFVARTDPTPAKDISNTGVFLLMSFVFGVGGFMGLLFLLESRS